jgi:hypothetical protein
MSDELHKDEDDVEGHRRHLGASEETSDEAENEDDEVEAHVRKANARLDSPRHI